MPCEPYKNALTEAVATGADPQDELRAHLAACVDCRATFAQGQALFSSIDAGLHASANTEVPASLLPRVRARLNEQPVAERNWVPAWMMIAATAAVVVLAIAYQSKRTDVPSPNSQKSTVAQKVSPPAVPAAPVEASSDAGNPQRTNRRTRPGTLNDSASVEQVSVLLPAGQKEALDALLASLQRGQVKGEVLLVEHKNLPLEDLRISPLDVSPIRMQPIVDASGQSQSNRKDVKH